MSDAPEQTMMDDSETLGVMALPTSLALGIARAEIDQQVTTARAFPRSIKQVTDRIFSLATLDEASAEECMYALPRGKGADAKAITGPSIRFAECVKQSYGNCRAAARVVHVDREEKYVEAEGVFHDLETNVATTARVRRRISTSKGYLFSDDMIIVTGNAACAIAMRNAIMGGVPKPLWRKAFEAVQLTIKGDLETLSERRLAAVKAFANFGVKPEQVFAAIGVAGGEDITVEHIPVLRGMFSALKNGEATVEEMFSQDAPSVPSPPQPLSPDGPRKTTPPRKKAATAAPEPAQAQSAEVAATHDAEAAQAPQQATQEVIVEEDPTICPNCGVSNGEPHEPGCPQAGEPEEALEEDDEPDAEEADDTRTEESLSPELDAFLDKVEPATTFGEIKQALQGFFGTPYFRGLDLAHQNHIRRNTWEAVMEKKAEGQMKDLPDHAQDVSAFRLWLEAQGDPDAIIGTFNVLKATPNYEGKTPEFKKGFEEAVEARIKRITG